MFSNGKMTNIDVLKAVEIGETVGRFDVCWTNRTLLGQNWKVNTKFGNIWNIYITAPSFDMSNVKPAGKYLNGHL